MNLETLTIAEARRALDAKEYSALQLTNAYLDAIAKKYGRIRRVRKQRPRMRLLRGRSRSRLREFLSRSKTTCSSKVALCRRHQKYWRIIAPHTMRPSFQNSRHRARYFSAAPIWTNSRSAAQPKIRHMARPKILMIHRAYPAAHRAARLPP